MNRLHTATPAREARVAAFALTVFCAFVAAGCGGPPPAPDTGSAAADAAAAHAAQHADAQYRCPMHPEVVRDEPGRCPICGMDLVPVPVEPPATATATASAAAPGTPGREVTISPTVVQNLGVRTAPAERGRLPRRVDTVGYVSFDERAIRQVRPRAEGWIERLEVRALGEQVRAGQPLFTVYSPMLDAAQREYRDALEIGNADLVAASRERLRSLGLDPAHASRPASRVTYSAPIAGVVTGLEAREGSMVTPDMAAVTITGTAGLWVVAEVPESRAGWIAAGTAAEIRFASLPGRVVGGQVDYVYPELNMETRTVRARVSLGSPPEGVRPNMLASVSLLGGEAGESVHVPRNALIRSGREDRVVVALGGGRFAPRRVVAGAESGERVAILEGLDAGEQVVVAGQFLLDSEANLRSGLDRLEGAAGAAPDPHAGH